ncbi:MAG: UDP-N-acetylmuramate dehydrogenase [bacterium]
MDSLIKENIPMREYTSLKVGGRARWFATPSNKEELKKVLQFAKEKDIPIFLLGGGTNTLIKDEGVRGMVIKLDGDFKNIERQGIEVKAGSGASLPSLISYCQGFSLSGLENLAGIPGAVGGAIFGNAGAFGTQIGDYVKSVVVMDRDGNERRVRDINFFYRGSSLKDTIILEALFSLKEDARWRIDEKIASVLSKRRETQPISKQTAGCIFKNPEGKFAGELIEKAGLKGRSIKDAIVSLKHANFIENRGQAKAEDILQLIRFIKRRVWELYGVMLYEEIVII